MKILERKISNELIFGHSWDTVKKVQQKQGSLNKPITQTAPGEDYGADPLGNGKFKMAPSGDIVDFDERCRRLKRFHK